MMMDDDENSDDNNDHNHDKNGELQKKSSQPHLHFQQIIATASPSCKKTDSSSWWFEQWISSGLEHGNPSNKHHR